MEAPSLWKIVKLVFLRKQIAEKKDQELQSHRTDVSDVEVVRIMHNSSSGRKKET